MDGAIEMVRKELAGATPPGLEGAKMLMGVQPFEGGDFPCNGRTLAELVLSPEVGLESVGILLRRLAVGRAS